MSRGPQTVRMVDFLSAYLFATIMLLRDDASRSVVSFENSDGRAGEPGGLNPVVVKLLVSFPRCMLATSLSPLHPSIFWTRVALLLADV